MNIQMLLTCAVFLICPTTFAVNKLSECPPPLSCLLITKCKPLMGAIKTTQNSPAIIRFLKAQICSHNNKQEPKVCCPVDNPVNNKSESPCKPSFRCVSLSGCGPLMYLVNLEKPMPAGIAKFIKSQQCGTGKTYPKVCCKLEVQESGLEKSPQSVTEKTSLPTKVKAEIMNKLFNNGFFDFINYDLFVR
ncbi:uncharacterized protein LOC123011850 [Tribolium madens]|uniref:uncharacterized protein LOC123011850 n=1 Tax=Tribolium madens TaxID=41895 RepID=UPI001CF731E4|nr:uncharacterized protein LOC123011850 [Tribolium madens]